MLPHHVLDLHIHAGFDTWQQYNRKHWCRPRRAQSRGRTEEAPSREPSDVDLSHWGKRNMDDEDYERQKCCPCGPASLLEYNGLRLGGACAWPGGQIFCGPS